MKYIFTDVYIWQEVPDVIWKKNQNQSRLEFLRLKMSSLPLWVVPCILVLLLISCSPQYPETCPSRTPVGLADANYIASNDSLPFRFPLDESTIDETFYFGWFGVSNECTPEIVDCYEFPEIQFHAAEDYKRPAGTPVYAMADGIIHFSGIPLAR